MNPNRINSENKEFILPSEFLGRELPFHIIFPENYGESSSATAVLYLLHGLFGRFDNWLTHTKIVEYAAGKSFAIVCLEGSDSWYADSPHPANHLYESYFLRELLPTVEKQFNLGTTREKRAVAGLSMGGYGAFKFAFRQPESFCFAASMSGAFHAAEIIGNEVWKELEPSILAVFGNDHKLRTENDLFQIIENFPAEQIAELPFFYFDCGVEDSFLPVNIKLSEIFKRRGITHEFRANSGGHDWDYWNRELENVLQKAAMLIG